MEANKIKNEETIERQTKAKVSSLTKPSQTSGKMHQQKKKRERKGTNNNRLVYQINLLNDLI